VIIEHTNKTHQTTCIAAEGTRQNDVAQAILAGGGSGVVAAAVRTAEIKFYRALIASAVANGQQSAQFGQALRDLGTGGA
jgi:hypothetical protein